MLIGFDEAEEPVQFRATYNLDHVSAPWVVLLAALVGALYIRVRYRTLLAQVED